MLRVPRPDPQVPPDVQIHQAREVLKAESSALGAVADRLDESFAKAVDLIVECSGSVIVTGMGKAGLIGRKVCATLASTGTRAHFLHPAEACHGDLGRVSALDVVLAFSHSGETREVVDVIPLVRQFGTGVIAVTSRADSALGRGADVTIRYGKVDEACPIGLAPSTSCAVMLAIGDALAFVLMRRRDFGPDDFGRLHPSGSLGRQLQRIDEVMRTGGQLRVAPATATVREAFSRVQKPGRRTGAVCLTDADGRLAGIFTDSDLARMLEKGDMSLLHQPMEQHMTRQPITARTGWLVRDVVEILKLHQVSEVPVVDETGLLVGLVDITDIVDLIPEAA